MNQTIQPSKGIMVVDDDPGRLRLITMFLQRAGFVPLSLRSPEQALEAVNVVTPDLFVISANLDETNGMGLCRDLREHPQIALKPILVLTMQGDECNLQDSDVAIDCLTIPFVSFELIERIKNLLDNYVTVTN